MNAAERKAMKTISSYLRSEDIRLRIILARDGWEKSLFEDVLTDGKRLREAGESAYQEFRDQKEDGEVPFISTNGNVGDVGDEDDIVELMSFDWQYITLENGRLTLRQYPATVEIAWQSVEADL